MADPHEQGRELYRRRAWGDAYEAFALAARSAPLDAESLEMLATAAYLTGRDAEFRRALEAAHRAYRDGGAPLRAARSAFWLGLTLLFQGEMGQATGWFARAERLTENADCVERGYLLLPVAERHLRAGRGEAARDAARTIIEIGSRFGDEDLVACGRHLHGRALFSLHDIPRGLALLDEAMLSVTSGDLSPIMTGLVYCSVIEACQQVYAFSRAREWTGALGAWCAQQPQMITFTRTCLVRRAEVLRMSGEWADAMAEAQRACEHARSNGAGDPPAAGLYAQAELHRLRGDFAAADEAYREAARLGLDPQPGLALLRAAQGRIDAAAVSLRRVLSAATGPLARARLLPAHVEIMLAAGDADEVRTARDELESIAATLDVDCLHASAAHARGIADLMEGDARSAAASLRRAFETWQRVDAPYEAARARVRLAIACRAAGDAEAGEIELDAARGVFERLGAAPDLAWIDSLHDRPPAARRGLTGRELQVLRLIAAGKTNKAIAAELRLSARTIDRHVSNIFLKLDVSSRTAATAFAYDHSLL